MLDHAFLDLRQAFRSLRQRPGFGTAAIATLALGIGASTAIFSVAYGVSLRPLPYPEHQRLVRVYESNPAGAKPEEDVSIGAFHEWRQDVPSFESAALFSKSGNRFLAGSDPQPVLTMSVSPAFFDVLGVKPLLGPGFKPEREYTRFTADDDAVLSYGAWQRLFGGRPDVIGQTPEFTGAGDNDIYRIVGVMPRDFAFGDPVDLWWPGLVVEVPVAPILRNWRYYGMVARLRSDATIERARAELETTSARVAREFPKSNGGWTATIEPLLEAIAGRFARAAWLLLAAVGVVLVMTCLNVGGLLVARAVSRHRETAIRVALGAGSRRLLGLWFTEASVLAVAGGSLGVLVASAGVAALKAAAPPGIPRLDSISVDIPALAVGVGATLVALAIFTIAPLRASRGGVTAVLKAGSSGAGDLPVRQTMRLSLTVAQCAGAATLVILAVLLVRTLDNLLAVDPGWNPDRVLTMSVSPPMRSELRRPWFRYVEWSDRLITRLEATTGIEHAAVTTQIPLSDSYPSTLARGRGKTSPDVARWPGVRHMVTDAYFSAMGIRLVAGRTFASGDRFAEPQVNMTARAERGIVVITESTARTLWPGRSPLGEAMWLPDIDNVAWREVVGVVEDIQFHRIGEYPALHVFTPWTQHTSGRPRLLVKTSGDPAIAIQLVRSLVQEVEPGTRIEEVATLESLVALATAQPRFTSRTVAAFGALALLLAAIGIYGTLSYLVGARMREIGIRLALGASPASIMHAVLRRGLLPAVCGGVIGVGVALALARVFRALLFEVAPLDLLSFASGAVMLGVVALIASAGPAYRASRVDPVSALRTE